MADLVRAAALGFESSQTPRVNALGQFIKNMLAMHQQKEVIGAQAIGEMGVAKYKQGLEEASPLAKAQIGAYESLTKEREKLDIKEKAVKAIGEGNPLPGFTIDETKKIAMGSANLYDLMQGVYGGGFTPFSSEQGKRIRVKRKSNGQIGSILEKDFNSSIYEKL